MLFESIYTTINSCWKAKVFKHWFNIKKQCITNDSHECLNQFTFDGNKSSMPQLSHGCRVKSQCRKFISLSAIIKSFGTQVTVTGVTKKRSAESSTSLTTITLLVEPEKKFMSQCPVTTITQEISAGLLKSLTAIHLNLLQTETKVSLISQVTLNSVI